MPETILILLLAAAILVLLDLVLAGGAMTMTGMSAMAGAFAHPLTAGALIVLIIAIVLIIGGPP